MENKFAENLKISVNEELRACQLKELHILSCFVEICEKYNLQYWLDYGTLLGAVRHKGFIPWDDDIDVGMPSEDLKKFLEIAEKELPKEIFLQTKKTDPLSPFLFAKLRDNNSLFVDEYDDFTKAYHKGIWIDIFEYVAYPSLSKKMIKFFCRHIYRSSSIFRIKGKYSLYTPFRIAFAIIRYLLSMTIWNILSVCVPHKKYLGEPIKNNGSMMVQHVEDIFPLLFVEFEGKKFKAPCNIDAYLKNIYNDYMILPPVENRKTHAVYINTCLNDKI